jgi:hypothetical protein
VNGPLSYRVVSPLDLDGKRYAPGRKVLLTAKDAGPLLGHTVVADSADGDADAAALAAAERV